MRRLLGLLLFVSLGCAGGGPAPLPDLAAADVPASDAADAPDIAGAETTGSDAADVGGELAPCLAVPSPEAQWPAGPREDGSLIIPGGRRSSPSGPSAELPGFPEGIALHPGGEVLYVASASRDDRRLLVVEAGTGAILQNIDQGESHRGLALSPEGERLYAAGGNAGRVTWYDVGEDRLVSLAGNLAVGGYASDLALSADGGTLYVGMLDSGRVVEIDTASMSERRRLSAGGLCWDLLLLEGRGELWVTDLRGEQLSVIDLESGETVESLALPTSPAGLAASPDERTVWVAVSGADRVAAIDTASRVPLAWGTVAESDFVDAEGAPLLNSNPNAVVHDAARGRLYVSRGADNAVAVLSAADLSFEGSLPTRWYPSELALAADGATLVVLTGKGAGAGPSEGEGVKENLAGSVTFVDLAGLDLAARTAEVIANFGRQQAAFPFVCEGDFPLPSRPGQATPIEHVVLIVKENKTFDCVFGDLEDLDVDRDPSLVRWGEEITPNLHALARAFTVSDNFYTEAPNSDTGHVFLTSGHLTEYVERIWKEKTRNDIYPTFPIDEASVPDTGNFFTHLIDHDVSLRIYGEIVGMFATSRSGKAPILFSDASFPGGPATAYRVRDEDKARYVISRIEAGELARFTYLLLPNDHTEGTKPGAPTPESMVADNDYAVGLVVEALSRSEFWDKSVIFIVQDDPQGCEDHVDGHRSIFLAVGPWVRRGYVSHVHNSFVSLFATMGRLLGVPPMGRPDASASPMWDIFQPVADSRPYEALPRLVPEELNTKDLPGAKASAAMDFRSPDRNLYLGVVLDAYRLWRMGRITREEAERRIADPTLTDAQLRDLVEEVAEDSLAFDRDWARYQRWLLERTQEEP